MRRNASTAVLAALVGLACAGCLESRKSAGELKNAVAHAHADASGLDDVAVEQDADAVDDDQAVEDATYDTQSDLDVVDAADAQDAVDSVDAKVDAGADSKSDVPKDATDDVKDVVVDAKADTGKGDVGGQDVGDTKDDVDAKDDVVTADAGQGDVGDPDIEDADATKVDTFDTVQQLSDAKVLDSNADADVDAGPQCPASCDDGNACTSDKCVAGTCTSVPIPDGSVCTGPASCNNWTCQTGVCKAGASLLFDKNISAPDGGTGVFESVAVLADGSYAACGGLVGGKNWMLRFDSTGTPQWSKLGGAVNSFNIVALNGGGFADVVASSAGSYVTTYAADGTQVWSVAVPSAGNLVAQTDGSIWYAGTKPTNGGSVGLVMKLESDGSVAWTKVLDGLNVVSPSASVDDAAATPDHGIAVLGQWGSCCNPASVYGVAVVTLGSDGASKSSIELDVGLVGIARFAVTTDGGVLVLANADIFSGASGKKIWSVKFSQPNANVGAQALVVQPDGGSYVACVFATQGGDGSGWLLRFGPDGALLWNKVIASNFESVQLIAVALAYPGVIAVGKRGMYGLVLHADPWGNTSCVASGGCFMDAANACDDGKACTLDGCTAATGCAHQNSPDGSVCPGGACSSGVCVTSP
jgi:hypothetical protein